MRDWLTGGMDSREFLALIDGLPDESLYRRWRDRGGDWTVDQYQQARLIKETILARADGRGYQPDFPDWLDSPAEQAAVIEADIQRRRRQAQTRAELDGTARGKRKVVS